jgi:hypothetical protein
VEAMRQKYDLEFVNTIIKENLDERLKVIEKDGKFYLQRVDTAQEIEIPEKAIEEIDWRFQGDASSAILRFLYALDVPYFQVYKSSITREYYESTNTEHETYTNDILRVLEGKVYLYRTYRRKGVPEIYRVSYTTYEEDVTYVVFIPLIPATVERECYYEKRVRTGRRIKTEVARYVYYRKWDGFKLVENRYEKLPVE